MTVTVNGNQTRHELPEVHPNRDLALLAARFAANRFLGEKLKFRMRGFALSAVDSQGRTVYAGAHHPTIPGAHRDTPGFVASFTIEEKRP